MKSERFFVTGAFGCIGAWAVKRLLDENTPVWTYDLPGDPHRLRLIMNEDALARVNFISGDITDATAFERAVVDNAITHIIHLAALQVPFVRADPVLGARVNVVGSSIVMETAKRHAAQVQGVTYASSAAVYGPMELYPSGPLAHDAPTRPPISMASSSKPTKARPASIGRSMAYTPLVCGLMWSTGQGATKA